MTQPSAVSGSKNKGHFTTTVGKKVQVHTYTAPDDGWHVTTHLVELPDQIIALDGQYMLPYAREAVDFARATGKPITRLYVSHYHPDHMLGSQAFNAPIYALPPVKTKIDAVADRLAREEREKFPANPNVIPEHPKRPQVLVSAGVETINGVRFEFRVLNHAETEDALIIALPDDDIILVQDLVYDRVHLFLGEKNFDGWLAAVATHRALDYTHILPGHGLPGGRELYENMVTYLEFARSVLPSSKDGDEFKAKLIERFPNYGGRDLLDHQKRFLFKPA
jgi:glyoxylase-like metal-dependent hydrolase (beta-lactamase superfamily II)